MDNGSNYHTIVPDTYNTSNLWGPSEFDVRQVFIVNYLYVVPFFKGQHNLVGKVAVDGRSAATLKCKPVFPALSGSPTTTPESERWQLQLPTSHAFYGDP